MAQRILNDGDSGLDFRTKLNDNFAELFQTALTFVAIEQTTPATFPITTAPVTVSFGDTVQYANNMTYTPATGVFTNVFSGVYTFNFFFSGNWGNGVEILLTAWEGAVQIGAGIRLTGSGAGTDIPLGVPFFISLASNSTIEIKVQTITGSTDLEIVSGSVNLALKVAT